MSAYVLTVNVLALWKGGFDVLRVVRRDPAVNLPVIPNEFGRMLHVVLGVQVQQVLHFATCHVQRLQHNLPVQKRIDRLESAL